jgi:hypothetical protein
VRNFYFFIALCVVLVSPVHGQIVSRGDIASGEVVTARIMDQEFLLPDSTPYHLWRLVGQPGQVVEITMRSTDFDAFLMLSEHFDDFTELAASNDDGAGGTDARIVFTLAAPEYWIAANTVSPEERGEYSLSVSISVARANGFRHALSMPTMQGAISRQDPTLGDGTYYKDYVYRAEAEENVVLELTSSEFTPFLIVANTDGSEFPWLARAGHTGPTARLRYRFPAAGEYLIRVNTVGEGETGNYTLTVRTITPSANAPLNAVLRRLRSNDRHRGNLSATDPTTDDFRHYHDFPFSAASGQRILVDLTSSDFDTYLAIGTGSGPDFAPLAENDDGSDGSTDSMLVHRFVTGGNYTIRVTSFSAAVGTYNLLIQAIR